MVFSLHSWTSWVKPLWMAFLRLSGSDHSAVKGAANKTIRRVFLEGKLWVYDLEESLDMANSRRSLKLMATPLSSSCSYKFLSYWMQSRRCSRCCCAAVYWTLLLLLCIKDSQDLVYQLLTGFVCHGHKSRALCLSPLYKSNILSLHKKWSIPFQLLAFSIFQEISGFDLLV